MTDLILKPGRDKPVKKRHPWIFSRAIATVEGEPGPGDTVHIRDSKGDFLAQAGYSPESQIRARIWSWDPDQEINPQFFQRRLIQAIELRKTIPLGSTNAIRLVHAESDRLPGLIVDRYDRTLVVQFLFAGVEKWREVIIQTLQELPGVERVYERSDSAVRELEGLEKRQALASGIDLDGEILIREGKLQYFVDIRKGQKTGFYLDQRDSRSKVSQLSLGKQVLDCYSYTGGFGLSAVMGGAEHVTAIESSENSIRLARRNAAINDIPQEKVSWQQGDVPTQLRTYRDSRNRFDLIILDPPKFAPTRAQADRAARGYKDINLLAFKLLSPGGLLVTFSCSGGISLELFQKIVSSSARDAGVDAQIIDRLQQGADHPVSLYFPEGAYLKGLVCRVL